MDSGFAAPRRPGMTSCGDSVAPMSNIAEIIVSILFEGLAYAMFLFIVSVGLSVTMGLMGFVNLAHGAFAMAGGYLVLTAMRSYDVPFFAALALTFVIVGAASVVFERVFYARLYKATELDQVLFTIGLAFMAIATYTYLYGPRPQTIVLPDYLTGQVDILSRDFPAYRVFVIAVGAALIAVLWYAFERTNVGAKIRAAVDNRRMAQSIGINVDRLFTLTFAVLYLVFFLLVVAVGGLGSLKGTLLAAILLGVSDTAGKYLYAGAGGFIIYAVAMLVLLIKPAGLYGRD